MRIGLRRKSLLLVEDNFGVQETIKQIAEEIGFCVICASDRKSAIELVKNRFFDVAVFDKRLVENDISNSDGLAVLKYVSSLNENTYTILMTGYGQYSDAVELQDYVMKFVEKKSSPLEMASSLNAVLINAMNELPRTKNIIRSEALFFGENNPLVSMDKALHVLGPRNGASTLSNLLEILMVTMMPIKPFLNVDNITYSQEKNIIKGLFWSRAIGRAVIVVISRAPDLHPEDIGIVDGWPDSLVIKDIIYTKNEKNLYASIIACSGVYVKDFYS